MQKIPREVNLALSKDPIMKKIIRDTDLPPSRSMGNVYHDLIRSITGQQLSTKVAKVIYTRYLSLFDGVEPEPHLLLETDHEALRSIGFSNQKARYVKNVAAYFSETGYDFEHWQQYSDDDIISRLTSIKGVGKWTAEMVLMFTFMRPDIFPVDDLGIQMGMKQFYDLNSEKKQLKNEMTEIAEQWRPFRTHACRYIWAARDNTPNK